MHDQFFLSIYVDGINEINSFMVHTNNNIINRISQKTIESNITSMILYVHGKIILYIMYVYI